MSAPVVDECMCLSYVMLAGEDQRPATMPRYRICVCGHSAAWHEDMTGACTYEPHPDI
jgi:hypothetical protein